MVGSPPAGVIDGEKLLWNWLQQGGHSGREESEGFDFPALRVALLNGLVFVSAGCGMMGLCVCRQTIRSRLAGSYTIRGKMHKNVHIKGDQAGDQEDRSAWALLSVLALLFLVLVEGAKTFKAVR